MTRRKRLSLSDYKAIEIAIDELTSYVEVVENAGGDEAKIRWAIRRLAALLLQKEQSKTDERKT